MSATQVATATLVVLGIERTTIVERLDEATRQIKKRGEEVNGLVTAARPSSSPSAGHEREPTEPHDEPDGSDAAFSRTRLHGRRA